METIIIDAWSVINNVRQWNSIKVESVDGNVELMVGLLQTMGNDETKYVLVFDSVGTNIKENNVDVRFTSQYHKEMFSKFTDFFEFLSSIIDDFKGVRLIRIVTNRDDIIQQLNKSNVTLQQPEPFWNELIEKRLSVLDSENNSPKPSMIESIVIKLKDFNDALLLGWTEGLEDPKTGEKLPGVWGLGMNDEFLGKNLKLYSLLVVLIMSLGYLLQKLFHIL